MLTISSIQISFHQLNTALQTCGLDSGVVVSPRKDETDQQGDVSTRNAKQEEGVSTRNEEKQRDPLKLDISSGTR